MSYQGFSPAEVTMSFCQQPRCQICLREVCLALAYPVEMEQGLRNPWDGSQRQSSLYQIHALRALGQHTQVQACDFYLHPLFVDIVGRLGLYCHSHHLWATDVRFHLVEKQKGLAPKDNFRG